MRIIQIIEFYLRFQFDKCAHGSSCKFAPFHISILPPIATPPLELIFISTKGARRRSVTYDDHPSIHPSNPHLKLFNAQKGTK